MPPRIAHPAGALVTHARFGRCGTHSQKTFAQTVLAESLRTRHSLLGELKRGPRSKTKKPKTKPDFRQSLSVSAFDFRAPLESPRSEQWMRGCPRGLSELLRISSMRFALRASHKTAVQNRSLRFCPQRPHPLGVTRECLCFIQARRIRGVFLFGYFILDKQNKVTRQQGETK